MPTVKFTPEGIAWRLAIAVPCWAVLLSIGFVSIVGSALLKSVHDLCDFASKRVTLALFR